MPQIVTVKHSPEDVAVALEQADQLLNAAALSPGHYNTLAPVVLQALLGTPLLVPDTTTSPAALAALALPNGMRQ